MPSSWPVLALWPLAPAARFLSAAVRRALIPTPPSGSRPCAPSSARMSTLSSPSLPSGALRSTGERPLFPSRQLFIGSSTTAWHIGWRAARVQIHHITARARASRHHTPSSLPPSRAGGSRGRRLARKMNSLTQHPHSTLMPLAARTARPRAKRRTSVNVVQRALEGRPAGERRRAPHGRVQPCLARPSGRGPIPARYFLTGHEQ